MKDKSKPKRQSKGKPKRSSKKPSKKPKLCKECNTNLKENKQNGNVFHELNDNHYILALDYCEEHETMYIHHKCKPCWCKMCGYLDYYEIILQEHVYGKSKL